MALPHADLVLPAGDKSTPRLASELCISLLAEWAGVQAADVSVRVVSGGITNNLIKARCTQVVWTVLDSLDLRSQLDAPGGREPVVLRIFGANTEVIIERARELAVLLQLNSSGLGAPVLATFANGRVERWLHARPLAPEELADPALSPRIAQAVAAFHTAAVAEPVEPQLWLRVRGWLETARTLRLPDAVQQARLERSVDFDELMTAVEEVQAACDAFASPTVYCHNDLLAPNFLLQEGDDEEQLKAAGAIYLIDFEYSAYGPRGYDLANHFCEWAGFECAYERYPSGVQQHAFLAAYLAAVSGGAGGDAAALAALIVEVDVFSLASHLYWGIWSLIQARYSALDFDYLGYHALRLAEFRRKKAEVLPPRRAAVRALP
jgi:ethanolamine kinase